MDIFIAIAGHVVAQTLELAAFADLAVDAHAGIWRAQKQSRGGAVAQVRIDAQGALDRHARARQPETERRGGFQVQLAQRMIAARDAGAWPSQRGLAGLLK